MKSIETAYLLTIPSFFGVAGLQRFYLGKVGTGILWLITGGLFGIGTIYDLITLPKQVKEARLKSRLNGMIEKDEFPPAIQSLPESRKETLEHILLRIAKRENGIITPSELALESDIPLEKAQNFLEQASQKGIVDMRVKKSGLIVYVVPDFFPEDRKSDFEQF
ncbi:MAG: TM2 domain-containing protein [Spirochaetia bacterium]